MNSSPFPPPLATTGPEPDSSRDCPEGFDNLLVLELAWRRHHNRRLCLSVAPGEPADRSDARHREADEPFVRLARHLENCPVCARWYQNAQRALVGLDREARRPVVRLPRPAAMLAADAGARPDVLLELPAGPSGSQGLNALAFALEWWSVPGPAWYVTLRSRAVEGGPDVRPYAGRRLRMTYRLQRERARHRLFTRLDLDQFGHLVSPPELLPIGEPGQLARVKLQAARRPAAGPDCT